MVCHPQISTSDLFANTLVMTESAFDTKHPYYDPKSKRDDPKWVVVHVEYRRKLGKQVTLQDLKSHGQPGKPLENLQMIKQSRLSVSSVTPAQWKYILELAGEEPQEEFIKEFKESSDEKEEA
jgi:predicted RNA-binding protein with PUA-like domain